MMKIINCVYLEKHERSVFITFLSFLFKGLRHPEAAEMTSKFTNFFLRNYECDNYFIIIYG